MLKSVKQSLSKDDFNSHSFGISDNPLDRIHSEVRADLENESKISVYDSFFFDVHAHSFTLKNIPNHFHKLLGWLKKKLRGKLKDWLFRKLDVPYSKDLSKEVMDELVDVYDEFFAKERIAPHLFIVNLMMDMERGISGGVEENFDKQIKDLQFLRSRTHRPTGSGMNETLYDYSKCVLPFLAVDPHNPNLYNHFISAFHPEINLTENSSLEGNKLFFGLKVYPTLGYMPYDPTLMSIFRICADKNIPITTHCGGVRTRANKQDFELGDFRKVNPYVVRKIRKKELFKNTFVYPKHWEPVLDELPDLKVNFAHMGENVDWEEFVKGNPKPGNVVIQTLEMIKKYPNAYGDISYSLHDEDTRASILDLMNMDEYKHKILYGSDYFLVNLERGDLRKFIDKLKTVFKDEPELWHLLVSKNPYDFLFKKT